MEITARQAALTALEKCRRDGAWSGAVIDGIIKKAGLDKREAALASRLCLGVQQNSSLCDFYIDYYCTAKKLEPKVRDILRMGVYQLVFLDKIPARAAVSESVALCRKAGFDRAAGLVNALLRRVSENLTSLPQVPNAGTAEHLSIKYSHSMWMVQRIIAEKGYAFTEEFLRLNNMPQKLNIQVNTLKTTVDAYTMLLDDAGIEYRAFDFPRGCIELSGGIVAKLPGFDDGLFYVQDRAARIAADIAAARPGMRLLDACAAPGGKSFAAALAMENKGSILSCDIHEKKLALIRSGADRLGIDIISTAARDARRPDETLNGLFDVVIADVPCSGLGVIGKKPEIKFKTEAEVAALPEIQFAILSNLADFIKPGGALVYSTCTVLRAENEDVVKRFLAANSAFELEPFMLGSEQVASGMRSFWPNDDGTDGFFAARLKRKI